MEAAALRGIVLGALAVLALGPAHGDVDASALRPAVAVRSCDPSANAGGHTASKASALAPRPQTGSRVYGAPIQQPIFRSRPARKPALASPPHG